MGNSAMIRRPRVGRTLTVGLLNGELAEFMEPVRASTVMKRYPHHVVLHCTTASNLGMGQRRNINVLKPDQALKRDQNYLVTPIQTAGNSQPFLYSWAFFTLTVNKKLNAKKCRHKTNRSSPKRRSLIQTLLDRIFRPSRTFHRVDDHDDRDDNKPLFGRNQPSTGRQTNSEHVRNSRPFMECIPESPTLSHVSSFNSHPRLDFG